MYVNSILFCKETSCGNLTVLHPSRVLILKNFKLKVDNWADNEALRNPSQKPPYRRSFSELPHSPGAASSNNRNRRSLDTEVFHLNFPKSSNSMTDIQSTQLQYSHLFGDVNRDLNVPPVKGGDYFV